MKRIVLYLAFALPVGLCGQDLPEPLLEINFSGSVYDNSANQYPVRAQDISFEEDRFGDSREAGAFDGESSILEASNPDILPANNFTVSGYFRWEGHGPGQQSGGIINKYAWFDFQRDLQVVILGDKLVTSVWYGKEREDRVDFSVAVETGTWYHFALTVSPGNVFSVYLDGCSIGSAQLPGPVLLGDEPIRIGNVERYGPTLPGTNHHFMGRIDQVALFGTVLSQTQLSALAGELEAPRLPAVEFDLPLDSVARDDSENGYAVYTTDLTFTPGRMGESNGATYFNGTTSELELSGQAALPENAFALSAWFNSEAAADDPGLRHIVSKYAPENGERSLRAFVEGDTLRLHLWFGDELSDAARFATQVTPDAWHQLVVNVTADNEVSFYVDGQLTASRFLPGPVRGSTAPFVVGSVGNLENAGPASNHHFLGSMEAVTLYGSSISRCGLEDVLVPTDASDGTSASRTYPSGEAVYRPVYPNPTTGRVYVEVREEDRYRVQVLSPAGHALTPSVPFDGWVDLSGVPSGTYILRLSGEHSTVVYRVIKR